MFMVEAAGTAPASCLALSPLQRYNLIYSIIYYQSQVINLSEAYSIRPKRGHPTEQPL